MIGLLWICIAYYELDEIKAYVSDQTDARKLSIIIVFLHVEINILFKAFNQHGLKCQRIALRRNLFTLP